MVLFFLSKLREEETENRYSRASVTDKVTLLQ